MLREAKKARKAADVLGGRTVQDLIIRKHVRSFQFGTIAESDKIRVLTQFPEVADALGFKPGFSKGADHAG